MHGTDHQKLGVSRCRCARQPLPRCKIAGGKVEYVRTAGGSVRIFVDTLWRDPHAGVTRPDTHGTWEDVSTPSEV